jgi:hypothetical protein
MVCCRRQLIFASLVAVAAFSLLAAGCGGGSSPGVANVASSTTAATTTTQSATTTGNGTLAFAHCMRSHGVPTFPDPDRSGEIPKPQAVEARKNDPSGFDAANRACIHLLSNGSYGPTQTITPTERTDYLKAAACMRHHGFPDFPDPTFLGNSVRVDIPSSIDQSSSRFRNAATICTKLIPQGLPYTRPPGQ